MHEGAELGTAAAREEAGGMEASPAGQLQVGGCLRLMRESSILGSGRAGNSLGA